MAQKQIGAFRAFLGRLLGLPVAPVQVPPRLSELLHRMDDLEDELDHLRQRLVKLQGRVTGGMKGNGKEPEPPDPMPVTDPNQLSFEQLNRAIMEGVPLGIPGLHR